MHKDACSFGARECPQLLTGLLQLGMAPSTEWLEAWSAEAERHVPGFTHDEVASILIVCATFGVALAQNMVYDMLEAMLGLRKALGSDSGSSGSSSGGPGASKSAGAQAATFSSSSDAPVAMEAEKLLSLLEAMRMQPYPLPTEWLPRVEVLVAPPGGEGGGLGGLGRMGARELASALGCLAKFAWQAQVPCALVPQLLAAWEATSGAAVAAGALAPPEIMGVLPALVALGAPQVGVAKVLSLVSIICIHLLTYNDIMMYGK